MRHAKAEVGVLQCTAANQVAKTDVNTRLKVVERARFLAARRGLAAGLGSGHPLRQRGADAQTQPGVDQLLSGNRVEIGCHESVELQPVQCQPAVIMLQHTDITADVQRPAIEPLDERLADLYPGNPG